MPTAVPGVSVDLAPYAARMAVEWDARSQGRGWLEARGSLVKIDLSGFTTLSERLARVETTGAEELNAVLNDVFVDLIEEVVARGGDVLQFGGDALLVWFEGDGHETRASAACQAMHRRLADRPAEVTAAGAVRLRMSAGVATGRVLFLVVGRDHRELIALGPTASRVELMEKEAASGQVVVDLATARALPSGALRPRPDDADSVVLRRRVPETPTARTPRGDATAAAFVPPDVRALQEAGVPVGEHRRSAVAFIGLTGLDAVVGTGDARAVAAQVLAVSDAVDEAVRTTGVAWTATDLMADGVVFLLYAGAPVASEDDDERLLRACRLVADRCGHLAVRIGAHAGRVFAADIGHPDRRTFAIIGDTTNLAARLMHRTETGTVLVSSEIFDASARDHAVDWLPPSTVKGRRRPVTAGRLGPQSDRAVRRRTHDLPLSGRGPEQAVLAALVEATAGTADSGALAVALVGEAGVGKSRLVASTVERALEAGVTVLHAAATTFDTRTPYAAVREVLRTHVLGDREEAPDVADRLAERVSDPGLLPLLNLPLELSLPSTPQVEALEPQFLQRWRTDLLCEVLLATEAGPLLVVLEDLHDLDRASTALIDALRLRALPGRLGVLVASRRPPADSLAEPASWCTLDLEPLTPADGRVLALAALGEVALSDADLDRFIADSGGNPLFLRELVALAASGGADEVPATAEGVIAARIDTLAPRLRRLLREVSCGGTAQRLDDLAAVLGDQRAATPAAWSDLGDFVLVEEGSTLCFRHELYRRTAYAGLPVRRRRVLHSGYADRLMDRVDGTPPDAGRAVVAEHLHAARRYDEAWHWSLDAARSARATGALEDAASLFRRAVDAGRLARLAASTLAEVHEELGDVAEVAGRYDEAESALRTASRSGPQACRVRRLVMRATVLDRQGRFRTALGQLSRAESQLRLLDGAAGGDGSLDRTRAALALRRSSVLHRLGRLRRAHDVAEEVVRLTEGAQDPVLRGDRARAFLRLEMIASEAGWPARFDLGRRALAAFDGLEEDRDLATLLGNLGITAWEADDWDEARRLYERGIEVHRRIGDVVGAAIGANNVGEIFCEQGDLAAAEGVFDEARRVFRAAGHAYGAAFTLSALGRVVARRGDLDRARSLLTEARTALAAMGSTAFEADARARLLEVELLSGRADLVAEVEALLAEVETIEAGPELAVTLTRYLALAHAQAGDLDTAAAAAERARLRAVEAEVAHEESYAIDVVLAVAALRGAQPDPRLRERRDDLWRRFAMVWVPTYPCLPRIDDGRSDDAEPFLRDN